MRPFVAALAIAVCCGEPGAETPRRLVEFSVDRSVVDIDNDFSRNNPYYKQRAGAFYEIKYVAPSAESLFKVAHVRPEQMPGTLDALRAFVYEWLDRYTRGNGSVAATERAQCVARLDERFDALFDTPMQRQQYRTWRDSEANKLRFLMLAPSVDPREEDKTADRADDVQPSR